jgi:N-acetylglucosamine transport system substrate-binding protein
MKVAGIKKRTVFIVLALLISLSAAGCTTGSGVGQGNQTTGIVQSGKNAGAELEGSLELQIFVGGYGDVWWKEAIEGFKAENPNLNVIVNMGSRINDQMKTRWVSDDPPDFVYCDGASLPLEQFIKDGRFMDLKNWFDTTKAADGKLIREHIFKGFIKDIGGKEYLAPYILSYMGLFYDTKLLKDNSIELPTDFDSFVKAGESLKSKGVALMCFPEKYPIYLWEGFVQPALVDEGGEELLNDVLNHKKGVFTSQPFKNVILKIETMRNKGLILKNKAPLDHTQSQMLWLQRKAAFIPNGLWLESEMKGHIPSDFNMQFSVAPIRSNGQQTGLVGYGIPFAISAEAKNPKAAEEFLAYLYREDVVKRFIEICGTPTCYSVDVSSIRASDAVKKTMIDISNSKIPLIPTKSMMEPTISAVAYNSLADLAAGTIDTEEYCQRVEEAAKLVE